MSRGTVTHADPDGVVFRRWTSNDLASRRRLVARYRRKPGFVLLEDGLAYDEHFAVAGEEWTERVTIRWHD